jgi:L-cystine uptake protein TcyP (sodium:dicarboxylate symporter family)
LNRTLTDGNIVGVASAKGNAGQPLSSTPFPETGLHFRVPIDALLASIGAAGIPHAGLVMMIIVLQAVGLPTERQGLIIAVDRVLDMCRTAVNVGNDSCGCAVISRFEALRANAGH